MLKTIYFPTNLNNKLDCEAFVHIDNAPQTGIPEKIIEETVIEIRTRDGSHLPVRAKLVDMCRITLKEVRDAFSYPSHAISGFEYYQWYHDQNQEADGDTKLAVYFYKKTNE